ncbi:hypothetical protein FRC03_005197 [Tulasnella sp. 419]|nr:hypothetical protein FRC03_005197 [Tulasnella sp. 419]
MIPGAIQGNGVGPSSIIKGVIGNGLLPPPLPGPPSVAGLSNPRLPIPPLPQLNVSLPTIPQPPVGTIPSMSAFSIPVVSPPTLPTTSQSLFLPKTVVQSSPSPGPGGNSGQSNKLSASDLSFFEGL